jgi:HAD superfamily phosphoserine phosphatase-like hydrolase
MKFIFDLDGTITSKETLPIISNHFGVNDEISKLTDQTIKGDIPFIESFIKRTHILGNLPVSEINNLLGGVPLSDKVLNFIQEHRSDCIIATGNFDGWIEKLVKKIGCQYFSSSGIIKNNKIVKLTHILKKETVVQEFKAQGEKVIFIGDGNNDVEAMRDADISIACGLIHAPAKSVLSITDYSVYSEDALCRLLNQIYTKQKGKSIVLNCAGIGSRLGLGQTKALIKIEGKPLIHYQLESLKKIKDIRVVIGFQAKEVVETVLEKRKDVIFVYNHDYFHTKTGASYYLGARHGNEYAIAWDGDLLVHPRDIEKCLEYNGEFVGCSDIVSDEPVFVKINKDSEVVSFSRKNGDFEWIGPACLKKQKVKFVSNHVFNQFESYLPLPMLKTEARDVDTYDDYIRAKKFVGEWNL